MLLQNLMESKLEWDNWSTLHALDVLCRPASPTLEITLKTGAKLTANFDHVSRFGVVLYYPDEHRIVQIDSSDILKIKIYSGKAKFIKRVCKYLLQKLSEGHEFDPELVKHFKPVAGELGILTRDLTKILEHL